MFSTLPAALTTLLTVCGLLYFNLCLISALSFRRQAHPHQQGFAPSVSILKPVKGVDREIYEAFRSHCLQNYPGDYEIIFGVGSLTDETVPLVERLREEFPKHKIRLVLCPHKLGSNGKVSNLVQMAKSARYDHLLVNDSDIRVPADYLANIMTEFSGHESDREVGMVTCLYRGIAGPTLGSKLEALGISTEFFAGVLCARAMEGGLHFGLGSTLACSRKAIDAIGGYEVLLDHLADDYELGARIHKAGYAVILAPVAVETMLPAYSMEKFLEHQLRWSRTVRDSRKWGHVGLLVTFPLPWALLTLLLTWGATWVWILLAATLLLRMLVAVTVGTYVLRDRHVVRNLLLLPLRDFIAFGVWIASFFGNTVTWRGEVFRLEAGKLIKVERA